MEFGEEKYDNFLDQLASFRNLMIEAIESARMEKLEKLKAKTEID